MPKRPRDINQLAKMIVDLSTGEVEEKDPNEGKNPNAVALGKLGGAKGGKARADSLSDERKKEIAQKAANAKWAKYYAEKDSKN